MIVGPTGTGWPGPSSPRRPRWTDTELRQAIAVALDQGRTFERHRIATAMAELDATERAAGSRAYAAARTAVRAEMAVLGAVAGRPWEGVGPRWRPWTPEKAAIYQGLLDSWTITGEV